MPFVAMMPPPLTGTAATDIRALRDVAVRTSNELRYSFEELENAYATAGELEKLAAEVAELRDTVAKLSEAASLAEKS